ncbi:MAG: hypothetical protein WHS38_09445 [Thermodesulforhabdaceae bacterium]
MKISPLEQSIEDIHWQSEPSSVTFESPSLIPGDVTQEHFLDEILDIPNLRGQIVESLSPNVVHRHILQPSFFASFAKDLVEKLRSKGKEAESPRLKRIFMAASEVLEEQRQNMDILKVYRSLLLKG